MEYNNLEIKTSENVYEPREDTFLAAMVVEGELSNCKKKSLSVLDMGTGTGLIGMVAAQNMKVSKVTFADINAEAIKIARENCNRNGKKLKAKCIFKRSNIFSNIDGKFDILTFNTPYLPSDEVSGKELISKSWDGGEEGIAQAIKFIQGLKMHMKQQGSAIIVVSSFGNLRKLRKTMSENNLTSTTKAKRHIFFEDIVVLEIRNKRKKMR